MVLTLDHLTLTSTGSNPNMEHRSGHVRKSFSRTMKGHSF